MDANKFISSTQLHNKLGVNVKTPSTLLQKAGVTYDIPVDMPIEEILANTECSFPILGARRLNNRGKTDKCEVQYHATQLIEFVMQA